MGFEPVLVPSPVSPRPHPREAVQVGTRLHGRALALARSGWLAIAALAVFLFLIGVPFGFAELRRVCSDATACGLTLADARGLRELGLSPTSYAGYIMALEVIRAPGFVAVGAIIFWRRSDDPMALFVALMLVALGTSVSPGVEVLSEVHPVWRLPYLLVGFTGWASVLIFFYLFPDGRFMPRCTRPLAAWWVVFLALFIFFPASPLAPQNWPDWLEGLAWVAAWFTGLGAQVYRYLRVSGPVERQQTKWVVFGLATAIILGALGVASINLLSPSLAHTDVAGVVSGLVGYSLLTALFLLVPLSIGVSILRHRLWDIDVVINRTLVYAALTAIVVGLYVLIVGGLGTLLRVEDNPVLSLLAAGVIVVAFAPLRDRLQRGVNRLMYGERDDPYRVLSRLGRRVEETLAPELVLTTIVETVAQALRLPYAAITLRQDDRFATVAEYGSWRHDLIDLPLVYGSDTVGQLLLAPRAPGEPFNPADWRLLEDLARQVGVATHAVRLAVDLRISNERLQAAREGLVTAREEERRRLRRDLHDGLGPALASESLKVGAIRKLMTRDQPAADALLSELGDDIEATIADIRQLVYDLRPPALDELGLVGAIRERVAQLHTELQVVVEAPDQLPTLPAAVEVAAYRIVQEALTNVARHARARGCMIHLGIEEGVLCLRVADDGVGLAAERKMGVGMLSMRERAEELGGTWTAETLSTGGTLILARLPLRKE